MASPPELQPYRKVQLQADKETRAILLRAARDLRKRIRDLKTSPTGIGKQVRIAQLSRVLAELNKDINALWADGVLPITMDGMKAAAKAAEDATKLITGVAYTALDPDAARALTDGLDATARAGIESAFRRVPRALSARVYKNAALTKGWVESTIRSGLIQGLTARELADAVYKYVDPNTPGGASYAAMRLARTEINNAFHERQKAGGFRPGVQGTKWNLSESHRTPDKCNLYAAHPSSLGVGVYPADEIPDKPHPHCFCYLTYVMMSPKSFKDALAAGDFDDELDRRTKANLARLGVRTEPDPAEVARTRQARIDAVRPRAELAITMEEAISNEASDRALVHHVNAAARKNPNDPDIVGVVDPVTRLVNEDRSKIVAFIRRWARGFGLIPQDRAGDSDQFDRRRHSAIANSKISDGEQVIIVRPGYVFKDGKEDIRIIKAVVQSRK